MLVSAESACSYEEQSDLNANANLIKINYEAKERLVDPDEYFYPEDVETEEERAEFEMYESYLEINVLNMTDQYYIEMTNNLNNEVNTINYNDLVDGVYKYELTDLSEVITFDFLIKSSSLTSCPNESIKLTYLTTPRENEYYYYDVCSDLSDENICKQFVTGEEITIDEFQKQVEDLAIVDDGTTSGEDKNSEDSNSFLDFINDNIIVIAVGLIVVVIGVIVATDVIRGKRRKLK